ncbi:MAG: FAD-dependent oxidoreductase [Candidatus Methanoperedens sp.]|nr:FAD-dependent oxidoreductase [Candidatus Methanoperedens sp.]
MVLKSEPSGERIVIIGGVAAGMSAASKARRLRPDIEIFVFEKSGYVSYGSCGLPYYISGMVKSPDDLVVYDARFFKEKRNIDVFLFHEATAIHPDKHSVLVKDLKTGEESEYSYDKLLISTGARAFVPPIKGIDLEGIFTMRLLPDGIKAKEFIRQRAPRKAVIVGAGYIGIEMAEAFSKLGIEVTMLARRNSILGTMDDEICKVVEDELKKNGVTLLKSAQAGEFTGENGYVRRVILRTGESIDVDMVLVATGVRPNSEIAKEAGIKTENHRNAIMVNQQMETNVPGIYAAGDCAVAYNRLLERPVYAPLGTTANKTGRVAGTNMAGGAASFQGIVGTSTFKVFDLQVARTGLTEKETVREGLDHISSMIESVTRAHYYPGASRIWIKLIAEKSTGRLLGAEAAGKEGVPKRIDIIATAITAGMTGGEMASLDLSYAPPFSTVWDPVLVAANDLKKKVEKTE